MASDEIGPLGYLAAAELLARVNPEMAQPFARRGLQRLDGAWFEKDVNQLLAQRFPPAETLAGLAASLRDLPEKDVEALASELPAGLGERLVRLAQELRRRPDAAPPDLVRNALRDAWPNVLKPSVEARLRALQDPTPTSP
jgi:hypothetical protein